MAGGVAQGSNLYRTIGGRAVCRQLSAAFYARVERDPLLRPLFPGKTLTCAVEEFAAFLAQFLSGPAEDAQSRWWLSLRESHLRFQIGRKERDAWMNLMAQALDDVPIAEPARSALRGFFERASAYLVNHGPAPSVADHLSPSPGDGIHREIARRWEVQRVLDEAVAAVRNGDSGRAITLAERFTLDRALLAALLAVMISSSRASLLDYVHQQLRRDPALVRERSRGRTLLHEASATGSLATVELLLQLGADPRSADAGRHTPLYCVGNECRAKGGGEVVRALVRAGANVDARDGVKRCTALHMAARRDNVEVAAALLECGADIEARDSLGDTSLRRAVNCDQTGVAALLLSQGADRNSKGSKGLTPLSAARSSPMKRVLRPGMGRTPFQGPG